MANTVEVIMTATIGDLVRKMAQARSEIKSVGDTKANVKIDGSTAEALGGVKNAAAGLGEVLGDGAGGVGAGVASLAGRFNVLIGLAVKLGAAFATMKTVDWLIGINAEMEQYHTRIEVMVKDATRAKQIMADAKRFADVTPFETKEVVSATAQLMAAGMTDYEKWRKVAGEWAAGTGVNYEETVRVLSRANAGQYGEAIERMRELGVSQQDLWSKGLQFGNGNEYLGTTQQLMDAIESIVTERFGGLMDKAATQWKGLISTLKSGWDDVGRAFSKPFFDLGESGLQKLTEWVQSFSQSGGFADIQRAVQDMADGIASAMRNAWDLISGFFTGAGWDKLGELVSTFGRVLASAIGTIFEIVGDVIGIVNDLVNSFGQAETRSTVLAVAVDALGIVFRALAITLTLIAAAIKEVGALTNWLSNVQKSGFSEANRMLDEETEKIKSWTKAKIDQIQGVKKAQDDANAGQKKSAEELRKEDEKALYDSSKKLKQDMESENKKLDARQKVGKAIGANAVQMAEQERALAEEQLQRTMAQADKEKEYRVKQAQAALDLAKDTHNIDGIRKAEQQLVEAQKESASVQEARAKVAEKTTAVFAAQVAEFEALGKYVYKYQKTLAEAGNIAAQGGDATVKSYESAKAAIGDYLGDLDKLRSTQIAVATSVASLKAITGVTDMPGMTKLKETMVGTMKIFDLYKSTQAEVSSEAINNNLVGIANTEKVANAQRLQARVETIRAMLNSESLGAQQRAELIREERNSFAQLNKSIVDGIRDAAQQIESLQGKAISTASKVGNILTQYFSEDEAKSGLASVVAMAESAWRQTSKHGLDQIESMLALKKQAEAKGLSMSVSVSASDVMAAASDSMSGIKDNIKTLQANMNSLVAQARDIGQSAAQNYFGEWFGYVDQIKGYLQSALGEVLPGGLNFNLPAVSQMQAQAPVRTTTNNLEVNVTVQGVASEEMERLADRAADTVASRTLQILRGTVAYEY